MSSERSYSTARTHPPLFFVFFFCPFFFTLVGPRAVSPLPSLQIGSTGATSRLRQARRQQVKATHGPPLHKMEPLRTALAALAATPAARCRDSSAVRLLALPRCAAEQ